MLSSARVTVGTARSTRQVTLLLAALSWPLVVRGLLLFLDSAGNRFWMGQYLGAEGLAVHTTTALVVGLLDLLFQGLSVGTSVLVARSVGARDGRGLSILASTIAVAGILWLLLAVVVVALSDPIARYVADEGVGVEPVRAFLVSWVLITIPANALVTLLTAAATGAGWTKFAMTQAAVHLTIAMVLSPICLRFLHFGYYSPSIAVGAAAMVNSVMLWRMMRGQAKERFHDDRVDRASIFDLGLWRQLIDIGMPSQLSRIATRIVTVAVVLYVGKAGVTTLAAYGVAMVFIEISGGAMGGYARAVQIAMAQDLGANAPGSARHVLRVGLWLSLVLPAASVALLIVFAGPLVRAFTADPAVVAEGVRCVRILCWVLFPAALWQTMLQAFAAAKATKRVLVATLIAQGLPLIILSLWHGEHIAGALFTLGAMYLTCLAFYVALAVPVLWRGVLAHAAPREAS